MQTSKVEVKVSLWGVGAYLLKLLLVALIGVNLFAAVLLTWTTLTVSMCVKYTVIAMMSTILIKGICDGRDREACR